MVGFVDLSVSVAQLLISFNKSKFHRESPGPPTLDSGGVRILNSLLEGSLEEPLKRHGTDWAHVGDHLNNTSIYGVRME